MTEIGIVVDRTSDVPLHQQISDALRAAIASGELRPGSRVENEIDLATRLGLSRPTVRRAMEDLVHSGLVTRRRGSGTVVAPSQVRRQLKLTSLFDDLEADGRRPTTSVLEFSIAVGSPETTEILGLEPKAGVLTIRRLRYAGGEPLAIMTNELPADIAPDYSALGASGLYASLREKGITIAGATQRIGARIATHAEAQLLGEKAGAPLLTLERVAYSDSGRIVEHGNHIYRASLYSFDMSIRQ
ncbi:MAG TPA: GntR family transcriptional regulator [Propionibacteriaceae bacterium]|nr:GntR family transcriptional regulator [Propionibacteriaceae bacterium]